MLHDGRRLSLELPVVPITDYNRNYAGENQSAGKNVEENSDARCPSLNEKAYNDQTDRYIAELLQGRFG